MEVVAAAVELVLVVGPVVIFRKHLLVNNKMDKMEHKVAIIHLDVSLPIVMEEIHGIHPAIVVGLFLPENQAALYVHVL